jgi:hypothetical protein
MEKPPRRSSKRKGATAKRRVIKKAKRELTLGQKLATTQKQILKLQEMIKKAVAHCGQDELDSEEWSIIAVTHFEYSVTRHPDDSLADVRWFNGTTNQYCNNRARFGDLIEDPFAGPLVLRCSACYADFCADLCVRLAQEKLDTMRSYCCYIEDEEKRFHSLWPDIERKTRKKSNSNPRSKRKDETTTFNLRVPESEFKDQVYDKVPPMYFKGRKDKEVEKPVWRNRDHHTPSRYVIELDTLVAVARVFRDWEDLHSESEVEAFTPTMLPKARITKDTLGEAIASGHVGSKYVVCSAAVTASAEFGDMPLQKSMQGISIGKRWLAALAWFIDSLRCVQVPRGGLSISRAGCQISVANVGQCRRHRDKSAVHNDIPAPTTPPTVRYKGAKVHPCRANDGQVRPDTVPHQRAETWTRKCA